MYSLILLLATRLLLPLLLLYSVFLLLRGHDAPGGGFSGGLVGGIAISLYMLGLNVQVVRGMLPLHPLTIVAIGLVLAAFSGMWSLLAGDPFLEGRWHPAEFPLLGGIHVGTPILFDVGVYCVAGGTLLTIITSLEEES